MTDIQNDLTGWACDASPAARSCQSQCKPRFLTGRTHEHANRGCSPMFACSRRILPSPAEAGFKPPHSRLERNEDNRGLRPRGTLYFLAAKSTKNSPADAFAYFVPSNVRPPKRRVLGGGANIHETGALSLGAEQEQPTACVPGAGGCIVLFLLRPLNAGRRLFPRKRHADGFGTFNFATLVFLLLARHSPQAVSARAACVGCHQKVVQTTAVRRE